MRKPIPYLPIPPAPEPEVPDCLRLDFEEKDGTRRTVYAKWRPLGIKHEFIAPIAAHDFTINSYAKMELKVKEGSKLVRIGDEELEENPNFDKVDAKLAYHMKELPLWPLPIEFRRSHGAEQVATVRFAERPLGIEFTNRAPIRVGRVCGSSPAERGGVREGWCVTRIGEADVRENTNFREVVGLFKEGVQPLDKS